MASAAALDRVGAAGLDLGVGMGPTDRPARAGRPAERLGRTPGTPGWNTTSAGLTSLGNPIERWTWEPVEPALHVLVIAGVHGDERACRPLAQALRSTRRPLSMRLSIIPNGNPDGWQANTRHNARGVDLNRNFPWLWNPRNTSAGSAPASEPETRVLMHVVLDERPDLVVWIHQPLGYVAAIEGTPPGYASAWADGAGTVVRSGIRHIGGAETWTAVVAGVPSLLVEADSWNVDAAQIAAHRTGFEAALQQLP